MAKEGRQAALHVAQEVSHFLMGFDDACTIKKEDNLSFQTAAGDAPDKLGVRVKSIVNNA